MQQIKSNLIGWEEANDLALSLSCFYGSSPPKERRRKNLSVLYDVFLYDNENQDFHFVILFWVHAKLRRTICHVNLTLVYSESKY